MPKITASKNNTLKFTTQSSFDSYVWGICNILCRSNCAGALYWMAITKELKPKKSFALIPARMLYLNDDCPLF